MRNLTGLAAGALVVLVACGACAPSGPIQSATSPVPRLTGTPLPKAAAERDYERVLDDLQTAFTREYPAAVWRRDPVSLDGFDACADGVGKIVATGLPFGDAVADRQSQLVDEVVGHDGFAPHTSTRQGGPTLQWESTDARGSLLVMTVSAGGFDAQVVYRTADCSA